MDASNAAMGIHEKQPKTFLERIQTAGRFCSTQKVTIPVVVDSIQDEVSEAYAAFPERLYIIGKDGRVAYKGGRGPVGFDPHELEQALILTLLSGTPAPSR